MLCLARVLIDEPVPTLGSSPFRRDTRNGAAIRAYMQASHRAAGAGRTIVMAVSGCPGEACASDLIREWAPVRRQEHAQTIPWTFTSRPPPPKSCPHAACPSAEGRGQHRPHPKQPRTATCLCSTAQFRRPSSVPPADDAALLDAYSRAVIDVVDRSAPPWCGIDVRPPRPPKLPRRHRLGRDLSPDGLVLTNSHVVGGARACALTDADGRSLRRACSATIPTPTSRCCASTMP